MPTLGWLAREQEAADNINNLGVVAKSDLFMST